MICSEGIVLTDLSNQEQSQAQAFFLPRGCSIRWTITPDNDSVAAGYVDFRRIRNRDTTLQPGDTVTLYVSQGSQSDFPM